MTGLYKQLGLGVPRVRERGVMTQHEEKPNPDKSEAQIEEELKIEEELTEEAIRELEERQEKYRNPWKRPLLAAAALVTVIALGAVLSVLLLGNNDNSADLTANSMSVDQTLSPDKRYAKAEMAKKYQWGDSQFESLDSLWEKESGWNPEAKNPSSGAYGIPQALPGKKMASAGKDWRTDSKTQIDWGLKYIKSQYGTPTKAWDVSESTGAY